MILLPNHGPRARDQATSPGGPKRSWALEAQRVVLEVIAILHPATPKQTEVPALLHPLSLPLNFPHSVKIYQQHKRHCQTAVIDSNYTVPKLKLTIQKLL